MKQYCNILKDIISYGVTKDSAREGLPKTISLFDCSIEVLDGSLPILIGKKVLTSNVISELIWFLRGNTNIKFLLDNNNHIWDDDCYRFYRENGGSLEQEEWLNCIINGTPCTEKVNIPNYKYGDCGYIYGHQWRLQENKIDQINMLLNNLINHPYSRYHIVNSWSWKDTINKSQCLPACHVFFQCNVRPIHGTMDKKLDISIWQRSCDMFLGVPYNLLSYGILHRLLCLLTGYKIGNFKWHGGDCHIYENQLDAVKTYINRWDNKEVEKPINVNIKPKVKFNDNIIYKDFEEYLKDDIKIINYNPLSYIHAPLSTGVNKYKTKKDEDK